MSGDAYTGLKRRKQTPWSVKFGDALVSRVIAVGGIGTIAAILLVVLVLLGTAFPLFQSSSISRWREFDSSAYRHFGIDEYGVLLWGMDDNGSFEVRSIVDGTTVASYPRQDSTSITCSQLSIDRNRVAIGLSDGSMQVAELGFETRLLNSRSLPEGVQVSADKPLQFLEGAAYQWFDENGVRKIELTPVQWSTPKVLSDAPLLAIDFLPDSSSNRLSSKTKSHALAISNDRLIFAEINGTKSIMTNKVTEKLSVQSTKVRSRNKDGSPLTIMLVNEVDHALVTWPNGAIDRFSLASGKPEYMESQSGAIGGGNITCAAPLLAKQTLLCGTDDGRLLGWMVTRASDAVNAASDGYQLALAHETKVGPSALESVSSSEQSHLAVVSDSDNVTALVYVTSDRLLCRERSGLEGDIRSVGLDPTGKVLLAATDRSIGLAVADVGYPEASFRSFFQRVWYEGHSRPKYIWQSSSGSEKSEIKLSLMPLIFGTFKATLYAMLISVPLAILAAIYTSEFLAPAARSRVKPVIELMASLPSVVLGYVAALVAAPYLQEHLSTVLVGLLVFPVVFIYAGNFWNLLPVDLLVRLQNFRLPAMLLCLPIAYWMSAGLGGLFENIWFGGNIVNWIGDGPGSGAATGGWLLLLLPVFTVLACFVLMSTLSEMTRAIAVKRTPRSFALFALVRLVLVSALVLLGAWAVAAAFNSLGWDLRASLFTNYQDRNALLVGGALGFCVIPIIYTISDDALQAVPQQLRSASLGCGATPWQTTVRVVVPSAMSGLFSAVMIGLGRAVGETMVVLMAAGNTPVMEWNPFNGFRTLSATLATELPEAAKGSTHFRTLFLAALLLFFFTLIANTLAEFVRIRFRKRASQL